MAYIQDIPEDDEKKKEQGPAPLTQAGTTISGATPPTATAPVAAGPVATPTTGAPRAGSFTNLSQYLTQNAPQAEQLGQQVGQFVQGKVAGAKSSIQAAQEQFNKRVSEQTVQQDPNLIQSIKSAPQNVINDPAQAAAAKRMREGFYEGPQNLAEMDDLYTDAARNITESERLAESLRNEATRKEIFSTAGIADRATLGKNILNNLLLGKNVEGVTAAASEIPGLRGQLTAAEQLAVQKAQAARATTQATAKDFQTQLLEKGAFLDQFLGDIKTREGQVATGQATDLLMKDLKKTLAQGSAAKFTPEQLALLKTTQADYNTLMKNSAAYKKEQYKAALDTRNNQNRQMIRDAFVKAVPGGTDLFQYFPIEMISNLISRINPRAYADLKKKLIAAPSASSFTSPYDSIVEESALQNPYATQVAEHTQRTQEEESKAAALAQLLGVPITRPLAPGQIERVNPAHFNMAQALANLDKLRKGVK